MAYTYGNIWFRCWRGWDCTFQLCISIFNVDDKIQWLDLAHGLNEGVFFFASAMRHVAVQKHHRLLNPMKAHIPEGAGESWLDDDQNLSTACKAWGRRMKLLLPYGHFSSENQKRCISRRWEDSEEIYQYMETHHGRQVIMSLTHPLLVRWKSDDRDVNVLIRFKAKMDAQSDTRLRCRVWIAGL